jgi:protein-tyrosine phosphatase
MSFADATWTILFVCTANICRSPMAERLTRGGLAARLGEEASSLRVVSAGTRGWEGEPMDRFAHETLKERSADPRGFTARRLTVPMIESADLILCAARSHRAEVVTVQPRAIRYAFTVREFSRLAAPLMPEDIVRGSVHETGTTLVERVVAQRGRRPPVDPADDDIPDPYGQSIDAFRACARLLADSLRGPVNLLTDALRDPTRS